jgi:hypothetical protein
MDDNSSTINPTEFVRVWTNSESLSEVCEATGWTKQRCQSKAAYLRRLGVHLKSMRGRNKSSRMVDELNEVVEAAKRDSEI